MNHSMRFRLALVTALAWVPASARASFVFGDVAHSTEQLGNFRGSLVFSADSATTATLTVTLTNTSPAANGGFLTAFVLNNPGDQISGIMLSSAPANFLLLGPAPPSNGGVDGSPFGQFAFGASTSSSFEGGGSPAKGIGVGQTGTFVFNLTGTNLTALDDGSFAKTSSSGVGLGMGSQYFVVRFRGFDLGGSDKVPAEAPVPEPSSIALLGLGLAAVVVRLARRRTVA